MGHGEAGECREKSFRLQQWLLQKAAVPPLDLAATLPSWRRTDSREEGLLGEKAKGGEIRCVEKGRKSEKQGSASRVGQSFSN